MAVKLLALRAGRALLKTTFFFAALVVIFVGG
jgi:hypothetical protein